MATASEANYTKGGISLKSVPKKGENVNLFLRPGDELNLGADLGKAELQLVGSDVVATLPGGGQITFVALGMMAFESNAPVIKLPNGAKMDVGDVLNKVQDVATAPKDSILVSGPIMTKEEKEESARQSQHKSPETPVNDYNAYYVQPHPDVKPQDNVGSNSSTSKYSDASASSVAFEAPKVILAQKASSSSEVVYVPKNNFDAYKSDYTDYAPKNNYTGYGNGDGSGSGTGVGPGAVTEAAKPIFYFKAAAHQLTFKDILDENSISTTLGGGGSVEGYTKDAASAQIQSELLDKTASNENMVISAENPIYFDATHLSRILRFTPQMPEGFYIDSFVVGGLPAGVEILDKDGNAISGSTVTKDNMIFKDSNGNEISFTDADFLTKIKSAEFTVKYDTSTIPASFNMSITANYTLDSSYTATTDINPNQSYTNSYTVVSKSVASASDFTYSKSMGNDEGFIFATNVNSNIIKDGSGNDIVYGGYAADTIYAGVGDDTIYGGDGNDILYGGNGNNVIDGGNGIDKAGYATVGSYSVDELQALSNNGKISPELFAKLSGTFDEDGDGDLTDNSRETQMLAYYNGAYINLAGFTLSGVDFDNDGTDDTINVISKFVDKTGFVYDADNLATNASTASYGLTIGYDKLISIENVEGSDYNDWIYGNSGDNILSGLRGSDILDGVSGNDTLYGGAGYDTLYSGSGNDTLDGGNDTDAANFQNSNAAVTVRLDKPNGDQFDDYADGYGHDTLISIEDIIGSNFGDTIVGNSSTNYLQGMGGNDIFLPGGGYDFIDGGAGQDMLTYYRPDYVTLNAINAYDDIQGITVDLNYTDFTMIKENTTGRLIDLVKNVEELHATNGVDKILGSNTGVEVFYTYGGNDSIESRNGNDTIVAGDGNDYVRPGGGADISFGGNMPTGFTTATAATYLATDTEGASYGSDTIDLFDDGNIGNITLNQFGNFSYNSGLNTEYAFGFENVYGRDSADTITGNDRNNIIIGRNGDDTINGMGGDDRFNGNTHNDGSDVFDGGDGVDTIDYSGTSSSLTVTLNGSTNATVTFSGALVQNDTIRNIENFIGSRGNDTIIGDSNDNRLDGYGGNDTIHGGGGNDILVYESGNNNGGADSLYGEAGNDRFELTTINNAAILDGGTDSDTLFVNANLNFSGMANTNFVSIETLEVAATRTATISAYQSGVIGTFTGSGNVVINGISTTADTIDMRSKDFTGLTGTLTINGNDGGDTLYGRLTGSNVVNGGNNDDTIYATSEYADTINGGGGIDTLDYSSTAQNINVTLNGGNWADVIFSGSKPTDRIVAIEKFTAGSGNDTITGDGNANTLRGGAGNDTIDGMGGTDSLYGDAGNDTIIARATNSEILDGGADTDTLKLAQTVDFRNITVSSFEILDILTYNATLNFSQLSQFTSIKGSGTLSLYGTAGNDILDFSNIDFSNFSGSIFADAGAGTDTLKLGTNDITISAANFNTFENFDMGVGSTLTVNGTGGGENFNSGNTMNFYGVTDDDAVIINGLAGNDTLRVDVDQISKVKFDGGAGTDTVYFTGTVGAGGKDLTADSYENNFSNIETINTGSATLTGNIVLSADAFNAWDNSASATTMTLDVTNAAQANKISVTEFNSATNTTTSAAYVSGTPLTTNNYSFDANGGGVDLTLQVV